MEVECAERPPESGGRALERGPHEAEHRDRVALQLVIAVDSREPDQHVREHRVAGGERVVVELLRPRHEALAVGRGEKEAAVLLVGEELDRESREPVRLVEPASLSGRDVELEEPVRHVRVVVEIAGSARAAIAVAAPKPALVVGERAEQELPQRSSGVDPVGPLEAAPGFGEGGERKPVPRRDRLVVTERFRALLSDLEEACAQILLERRRG